MQEKLNDRMIGKIYSFSSFYHLSFIDLLSSPSSNQTQVLTSITNAKKLYASCMDEEKIERDGIDSVISLINEELGGWPILEGSKWDISSFSLYRSLIKLAQLNRFLFFSVHTYIDEKNSSAHSILVRNEIEPFLLIKCIPIR